MNNLIGQRFERLIVIKFDSIKNGHSKWLCVCNCGNKKIIYALNLKNGSVKSCGCFRKEMKKKELTTHGRSQTRTYKIWQHMFNRCNNTKDQYYKNYGGRGITVCERWFSKNNGFINFLEDMGECPLGLSIDRIDNDLGYYKENCRWATTKQQQRNKRNNIEIFLDNKRYCLAELVEKFKIKRPTLSYRLNTLKLPIEKALNMPVRKYNGEL